jgi:hypothetical protein
MIVLGFKWVDFLLGKLSMFCCLLAGLNERCQDQDCGGGVPWGNLQPN